LNLQVSSHPADHDRGVADDLDAIHRVVDAPVHVVAGADLLHVLALGVPCAARVRVAQFVREQLVERREVGVLHGLVAAILRSQDRSHVFSVAHLGLHRCGGVSRMG
jgi:hypothetical protein